MGYGSLEWRSSGGVPCVHGSSCDSGNAVTPNPQTTGRSRRSLLAVDAKQHRNSATAQQPNSKKRNTVEDWRKSDKKEKKKQKEKKKRGFVICLGNLYSFASVYLNTEINWISLGSVWNISILLQLPVLLLNYSQVYGLILLL